MKKNGAVALCAVFLAFVFFTLGFFRARTCTGTAVVITRMPSPTESQTLPAVTVPELLLPLDINTAGPELLTQLPGIGEVLAGRIIDYRTEHGAFQKIEDLMNVEGIGAARLEQLRPCIFVGGNEQ